MKFILCLLVVSLYITASEAKNLIHLNTLLSAFASQADPAAVATGPLKRPIRVDSNQTTKTVPNFTKFGKPVFVLDYEKNSQFLMSRTDVEMDNPCVAKQGYIGLVSKTEKINNKSENFIT